MVVPLSVKVTVPVGVPLPLVTVAVYVTELSVVKLVLVYGLPRFPETVVVVAVSEE